MCERFQRNGDRVCAFKFQKYFLIFSGVLWDKCSFQLHFFVFQRMQKLMRMSIIHILVFLKMLGIYYKKWLYLFLLYYVLFHFLSLHVFLLPKCFTEFSFLSYRNLSFSFPMLSLLSRCDSSHINMHRVYAFYYLGSWKWC